MKRILIIDDMRVFEPLEDEEIVTMRDLFSGMNAFENPGPLGWDEVWLDHDLGGDSTIRPLVSAVEESAHAGDLYNVRMFVIITDNSVGRDWMIAALSKHYPVEVGKRDYRFELNEKPVK